MTTIQVRIDKKTKKATKKVLNDLGIDMSTAIKVYLKQIVITQGIPLKLFTENGFTLAEENVILQASCDARKGRNITRAMNWKQVKVHLDNLK